MKLCPETAADFKKYFGSTFIVIPEAEPTQVGYVRSVDSHETLIEYQDMSKALIKYGEVPYEVKSPLTNQKQYFQINGDPFLIFRIPARMWRKGINKENTAIKHLNSGVSMNLSFPELNAFLQNKDTFPSLNELKDFASGMPLNKDWLVQKGSLFFKDWQVGSVNLRHKVITIGKDYAIFFPTNLLPYDWRINYA